MPEITVKMITDLRERTGAGMMDCKKALVEVGGDPEKAVEFLRKKGLATAARKAMRTAEEGIVASYVHHNSKVGVLVELNCETDFVARTDEFKALAAEIAMHVAWANPAYVSKEQVPQDELDREISVERERARAEGKPEAVLDRIVQGRLAKFYETVCLLEQPYIRDNSRKVKDVISDTVAKVGENIMVGRFARIAVGSR